MKKHVVFAIFATVCSVALAIQYSRLTLKASAQKYGKWDALVAWMKAANVYDDFLIANNLSDEHPQFTAVTNALVQAGVATSDEIKKILSDSVDTAVPDTALINKYNRDMQSASGRKAWHGAYTSYIDSNACERVYIYEDGYKYTEKWKRPESEMERRIRKAKAMVAAAERSARNKPEPIRRVIIKRAQNEAMVMTNGVKRVSVDVKTGNVVTGVK